MLSNYQKYEEKASTIRKRYHDLEQSTKNDKSRTEVFKKSVIGEARAKATEELKTLKMEYFAAKKQEEKDIISQAFVCRGNESAYLQTMMQADGMDNAHRQRAVKKCLVNQRVRPCSGNRAQRIQQWRHPHIKIYSGKR